MNRCVVYARGRSRTDVPAVVEEPDPARFVRTTVFPVHPSDLQAAETYTGMLHSRFRAGVEPQGSWRPSLRTCRRRAENWSGTGKHRGADLAARVDAAG